MGGLPWIPKSSKRVRAGPGGRKEEVTWEVSWEPEKVRAGKGEAEWRKGAGKVGEWEEGPAQRHSSRKRPEDVGEATGSLLVPNHPPLHGSAGLLAPHSLQKPSL